MVFGDILVIGRLRKSHPKHALVSLDVLFLTAGLLLILPILPHAALVKEIHAGQKEKRRLSIILANSYYSERQYRWWWWWW